MHQISEAVGSTQRKTDASKIPLSTPTYEHPLNEVQRTTPSEPLPPLPTLHITKPGENMAVESKYSVQTPGTENQRTTIGRKESEFEAFGLKKSCFYIYENAVFGTEKKGDEYYQVVTVPYKYNYLPRNIEVGIAKSIDKSVSLINNLCVRFYSCVIRVRSYKMTRKNMEELLKIETMLRNGIEMESVIEE